jgi:hypothetical protein
MKIVWFALILVDWKEFWRWCVTLRIIGLWNLSVVQYSNNYRTQRFGKWICIRPWMKGKTPILLGPWERVTLIKSKSKLLYDWPSVSLSWCRTHSGTCDQILIPVGRLLSESCTLVSVVHPLWRENGSAVCSAITQWSESRRTRNHTLVSHLRLPQPGGLGSRIYIPPGTR